MTKISAVSACLLFLLLTAAFPVFAQSPAGPLPQSTAPQSSKTLSLDEALAALDPSGNAELRWEPFSASGTFAAGKHEAAFVSGAAGETGPVLLDHKDVMSLPLPFLDRGDLMFPDAFISGIKNTFIRYAEEDRARFRIAAIIIDPGHGGRDPGAVGEHNVGGKTLKSVEKDITLKTVRRLHALLSAAFPDKRLLLTREGDDTRSLEERVNMANSVSLKENEAAIYISVHANASFNKNGRGYEVWYLSPGYRREVIDRSKYADSKEVIPILNTMLEEELTTESVLMARSILKRIDETAGKLLPSRGLKAEEWFVVRNARMPSVLVELGFVSNETDALLMNDDAYLQNLSEALYKGISDFVSLFERSGGFTALQ